MCVCVCVSELWTAASIILSFRKCFAVVILATWAHSDLMSASEYIISIFSSLKFPRWIGLCVRAPSVPRV